MSGWTLDLRFAAAVLAIVLGTVAGVLTATLPGVAWVPPVVAGITALAALVRRTGDVPDDPALG